jgi:hypothetical protein
MNLFTLSIRKHLDRFILSSKTKEKKTKQKKYISQCYQTMFVVSNSKYEK